jgi:hypothetical protein
METEREKERGRKNQTKTFPLGPVDISAARVLSTLDLVCVGVLWPHSPRGKGSIPPANGLFLFSKAPVGRFNPEPVRERRDTQ